MRIVTFIVSAFIIFAGPIRAAANQAFLAGTENVIDLKKVEIPNFKMMVDSVQTQKNNKLYSLSLAKELALNGQKIKVYRLKKRFFWQRIQYPLPWLVSVNEQGEILEINGAARVDGKSKRVDFILDN